MDVVSSAPIWQLLAQGKVEEAEALCTAQLRSGVRHADLDCQLATIHGHHQRFEQAEALLKRALLRDPNHLQAWTSLAGLLLSRDQLQKALQCYRRALLLQPELAALHYNLGVTLLRLGEDQEAISALREALRLRPDYPQALNNLGSVLRRQGRLEEAVDCYRRVLALHPQQPISHNNLANVLREQQQADQAIAHYQQAISLDPLYGDAHANLAGVYRDRGQIALAISWYRQALVLTPESALAHLNLGLTLLLAGQEAEGWREYDWRLQTPALAGVLAVAPALPRWQGEPLAATEPLLLLAEQGLGDTLQFLRYVPLLRGRGLQVRLCAPEPLHGLIESSDIGAPILSPALAHQQQQGCWLPLMSLPALLGASRQQPLRSAPYLHTTSAALARWQAVLSCEAGPLVAINWQGNPAIETGYLYGRSLPLAAFETLTAHPQLRFVSLQKGPGSEQLGACGFRERFVCCQAAVDEAWDFCDTAAIISCCDLLITSDTAVAHLAAGMGQSTWLLLKQVPEWRWGLEGDSSGWYPSMRLFRQRRSGDWAELMQRVLQALYQRYPLSGAPAQDP